MIFVLLSLLLLFIIFLVECFMMPRGLAQGEPLYYDILYSTVLYYTILYNIITYNSISYYLL